MVNGWYPCLDAEGTERVEEASWGRPRDDALHPRCFVGRVSVMEQGRVGRFLAAGIGDRTPQTES